MEFFGRDFERSFYPNLNRELGDDYRRNPNYQSLRPGNDSDSSPVLFVLTYMMAAAFCGLVLYYQFTLLPQQRFERESLHSVQNKALQLRAQLFELFFLQQDFLNQELVAKLPPKDAEVKAFLEEVYQTVDEAFDNDEADASVAKSFATTFENFEALWRTEAQRALKGDPEGAKFGFLAEEPSLRASMMESVETQIEALRTSFAETDRRLHERQHQFAYLVFGAGLAFLLLFLGEMSTYFRFRRVLKRVDLMEHEQNTAVVTRFLPAGPAPVPHADSAEAAPAISADLSLSALAEFSQFEQSLDTLKQTVVRLVNEGERKKDRLAELGRLVQPLFDLEAKFRDKAPTDREAAGQFLQESQSCLTQMWNNLGQFSGAGAEIVALADGRAEREIVETLAKLDSSRRKIGKLLSHIQSGTSHDEEHHEELPKAG